MTVYSEKVEKWCGTREEGKGNLVPRLASSRVCFSPHFSLFFVSSSFFSSLPTSPTSNMTSRFQKELDIACAAVQHCAVLTKQLQKDTLSQDSQISKSDFSPVTIGDFASQALLTSAVHGAFPTDNFLAEESADDLRQNAALMNKVWALTESVKPAFEANVPSLATPATQDDLLRFLDWGGKRESSNEGRTWVFDPIDGTATFLKGN